MKFNSIKRKIAGLLACVMLLGNVPVVAQDAAPETLPAGTYSVPIAVQASDEDNTILSNSDKQFQSPASLTVAEDGSITLVMDVARTGSTSGGYYYPKNIKYKTADSEDWMDVVTLESERFTVSYLSWSRSDTRPSQIQMNLTSADIDGFEIAYGEYKITYSNSNSLNSSQEGYLAIDLSDVAQEQVVAPVMSIDMPVFSKSATITMTSETVGADIYYTLNGGAEQRYTAPVVIDGTTTIEAYGALESYVDSDLVETTYTAVGYSNAGSFGPYGNSYEEGIYDVTVSAKKSGSSEASSYNGLIVSDAKLMVDANGDGTMFVTLQHGNMMSLDCYLENVTYYNLDGSKVAVDILEYFTASSYINSSNHPPKVIAFPVLDTTTSVIQMNAQAGTGSYQAYHDFDLHIEEFELDNSSGNNGDTNTDSDNNDPVLPPVVDTGFLFGSAQTELTEGNHQIGLTILQADDHNATSHANAAVVGGVAELEVSADGVATFQVKFQPITIGFEAEITAMRYYLSDEINEAFLADATLVTYDEESHVATYEFTITNKALDGLYINMDIGDIHSGATAYMSFAFAGIDTDDNSDNDENNEASGFGSGETALENATYDVPVALKLATDISSSSMAADALGELGILEVYEDGSASVILAFSPLTFGDATASTSSVQFYDSNNTSGNLHDALVLEQDEEGNPTSVKIAIPDNSWDGIYVQLGMMGSYQKAYVAIDYAVATQTGDCDGESNGFPPATDDNNSDNNGSTGGTGGSTGGSGGSGGSTGGTVPELDSSVANGTYSVPVFLKKYDGVKEYTTSSENSMAADAVVGTARAVVKGDTITYTIQFQGIHLLELYGHLTNLWYYTAEDVADGQPTDPIKASITSYYNDYNSDGDIEKFPETVTFPYEGDTNDVIYIQTYVDAMEGYHYQDAVLLFNWSKAVKDGGNSSGGSSGGVGGSVTVPKEELDEEALAEGTASEQMVGSFIDVAADAWYGDAVSYVLEAGLFVGTSENTFHPQDNMTRAMIMTVLHRLSGDTEFEGDDQWHSAGLAWAVTMGITDGSSIDAELSREQLVTLLYRYSMLEQREHDDEHEHDEEEPHALAHFHDHHHLSDWAEEAMIWAFQNGIISGTSEDTLAPTNHATRAQVATILMRFVQLQDSETETELTD